MSRVLVLGGGPAGLESAWHLAQNRQEVILVEKEDSLGGNPRNYNCKAVDECRRCGVCLVKEREYQVKQEPLIKVLTGSRLTSVVIKPEGLLVGLESHGVQSSYEVAGVIVAVGFELINPQKFGEFGYGKWERVITARELETILYFSQDWEKELGPLPRIAFIQCVGSREQNRGVSYCSRVCCLYTEKLGQIILDRVPGSTVDVYFMDRQKYDEVYAAGFDGSIGYIRALPSRVERQKDNTLVLRYEDLRKALPQKGLYDWIVLCPALVAKSDNLTMHDLLGVILDEHGFIKTFEGTATSRERVFAAGSCTGPKTILESSGSGRAAAEQLLARLVV